jgi:nicotinate dehydrogenase subunit B
VAAGKDPVQMRLEYLKDERSRAVIEGAARLANWKPRTGARGGSAGPIVRGRGFSYVRYQNESTYVAMVADVVVDRRTGKVRVENVFCSHDCGQVINPDGLVNQLEGQIVQTISRTLLEEVRFDASRVTTTDWASYPILTFPEVPKIEVQVLNRPDEPPWGAGEMTAAITPAAVGNAIHDALGVRLRTVPFTPQRVLAALKA